MAAARPEVRPATAEIRPMLETDLPQVMSVEMAAYQFPWTEGIFRDCLHVGYTCRVLDIGGDVAGYGIMSLGAGEAHILNLCIRAEYQCRGFGRRLLLYLLDRARASGMQEAFLEVRPSNSAAVRLYTAMGFENVGVRRGYYQAIAGREDATVLRRLLES